MIRRVKNNYHLGKAVIANVLNSFPARKMKIVAVTGTDGKTTTTSLIYHILQHSGYNVAMISTIGAYINNTVLDTGLHVTTPSSFFLQKTFKMALQKKVEYFVLEVTSHGIDQNRIWGVPIKIGVLTNVTEEHLDYHQTYQKYLNTKLQLLKQSAVKIVNKDDRSYIEAARRFGTSLISYGLDASADVHPGTFSHPLGKDFNTYNILAAVAVARNVGIEDKKISEAISTFKLPNGRQNVVYDKDFRVMIDFAHTPNSIENILHSVREKTTGRIIHVFGSAGERDAFKRPLMGEASSRYADIIILTAEDPRTESVSTINHAIAKGFDTKFTESVDIDKSTRLHRYLQIPNRQEAIEKAIQIADRGDLVVITGKGHEKSINYGNGEEQWDELTVVQDALQKRI